MEVFSFFFFFIDLNILQRHDNTDQYKFAGKHWSLSLPTGSDTPKANLQAYT